MDILNELLKKITPLPKPQVELNLIDNINLSITQLTREKTDLENYIILKKDVLIKLEETLELISKSEETQKKIKQFFVCKTCSNELQPIEKNREILVNNTPIEKKPLSNGSLHQKQVPTPNPIKNISKINGTSTPNTSVKPQSHNQFSKRDVKSDSKPSKNESQTFNRIQNILSNVSKPKSEITSKKVEYSADNKCVKINRTKPYPGNENPTFDFTQFKLVELHRKETPMLDFNSITKWTIITKKNNNKSLEKKMLKRNENKLNQLKQEMDKEEFDEFTNRNDIINDMKMLMNYDFCNNKHGFKKSKPKKDKKKKETHKTPIESEPTKTLVEKNAQNDEFLFDLYGLEVDNKENMIDTNTDDLYDDLNDDPCMDINDIVSKVALEEGEVNDDGKESEIIKNVTENSKKETKQFLSPRKDNRNIQNNLNKKSHGDIYSQRRASDRYSDRAKVSTRRSRSRSSSRYRKRSRSRTRSRSRSRCPSKRKDFNRSYDDRKQTHHQDSHNSKSRDSHSNSKYKKF
ncbi:unnamed protein product [Brachionus calyciflorus]|uniref:Uncharacterized protein n=1 Tax=Brachionus calyciflorus TaxID=104777 RepID=A0A813SML2_9BILA|nr:unnamed protein product [Brachionus calyciflorus]